MYTIHADVKITRRKTLCHICDHEGDPIWSGGRIFEAFEQMIELREFSFLIEHEGKQLRVCIGSMPG